MSNCNFEQISNTLISKTLYKESAEFIEKILNKLELITSKYENLYVWKFNTDKPTSLSVGWIRKITGDNDLDNATKAWFLMMNPNVDADNMSDDVTINCEISELTPDDIKNKDVLSHMNSGTLAQLDVRTLATKYNKLKFTVKIAGGSEIPEGWIATFPEDEKRSSYEKWWKFLPDEEKNKNTNERKQMLIEKRYQDYATEAMKMLICKDMNNDFETNHDELINAKWLVPIIDPEKVEYMNNLFNSEEIVPVKVINLWNDLDLTDWATKYAPFNEKFVIKSNEVANKIYKTAKTTLTKYPIYSRMVLNKAVNEEFNAISGRLGSVITLRKIQTNPEFETDCIMKAYMKQEWCDIATNTKNNQ